MDKKRLIDALSNLKVETGSLACLGCGHEHDCGTNGCAIIREAVSALQMSPVYQCQVCDYWGPGDPRCFCSKSPYGGRTMRANDGCSQCSIDVLTEVTAQLTASEAARAELGKRLAKAEQELQRYRDTGLEPEDLQSSVDIDYVRIIELLKADKDGRLVVLPDDMPVMGDYLEPIKVQSALKSELMKLRYRKEHCPNEISVLDYTIIEALKKILTREETDAALKGDNGHA